MLRIIYPHIKPDLLSSFATVEERGQPLSDIVAARLNTAKWLMTKDTAPRPPAAMYYLQLFVDSHIEVYKHSKKYASVAACPKQLYPENTQLYCQTTLPAFGIDSIIPEDGAVKPMEKLIQTIVTSVDRTTTPTRAISSTMKDDAVQKFVQACVRVSVLGNYMHVERRTYHIEDRIALIDSMDKGKPIAPKIAEAAVLEYIASTMPTKCPATCKATVSWSVFTEYALAVANATFRSACPMPPKLIGQSSRNAELPVFAEVTQIGAVTGNRTLNVCTKCSGMASYIKNRPHGMKPLKTYTDPFADTPKIYCIACDTPTTKIYIQNCYMAIARFTSLMACPMCNHVHCVKGPIITTLCSECVQIAAEDLKKAAAIVYTPPEHENLLVAPHRTCYKLNHPIQGTAQAILQLVWDPVARKILRLATCHDHRSIPIIVTSAYTPSTQKESTNAPTIPNQTA